MGSLLDRLHTKEIAYYLLAIGALVLGAVFSYRAAIVWDVLFEPLVGWFWAAIFAIIIFMGIGIAEFVAAIQWKVKHTDEQIKPSNARNWTVIFVVMLNDAGGVAYAVYSTRGGFSLDPVLLLLTIGATAISALPFIFGNWMAELAPHVPVERAARHEQWTDTFAQRMERKGAGQIEKEVRKDREKLKLFAPRKIRDYVDGTITEIGQPQLPANVRNFPTGNFLRSDPVTAAPIDATNVVDYEHDDSAAESPYTIEEENTDNQPPFQQGRLR